MSIRSTIVTRHAKRFDFRDPRPEAIDIADFIEALPKQCRFTGHCKGFYSNAVHSIFVANILARVLGRRDLLLEGLLHEGNEVYMNDVNSPLKGECPDYKAIQKRIEVVVAERFRLNTVDHAVVKQADWMAYSVEQWLLMPQEATLVDIEAERAPDPSWALKCDAWPVEFVQERAARGYWREDQKEFKDVVYREINRRDVW